MKKRWSLYILFTALPAIVGLLFHSQQSSYAATCIIPESGPWPLCARQGKTTTNASPAQSNCVIPESGPWPPCARQGGGIPASAPPSASCVIPPSGPWPSCATQNNSGAAATNVQTQSSCRYGMSINFRSENGRTNYIGIPWLETVGSGWYLDFGFQNNPTEKASYIRQIRVSQDLRREWSGEDKYDVNNYLPGYSTFPDYDRMSASARKNPGSIWVVGNEPDRFKFQDDMQPQVYARVYHDTYQVLKKADPTAQVAPAALVQVTPARLQYLDIVLNTYQQLYGTKLPVDIWTAHVYPLAEKQLNGDFGPAGIAIGTDPALAILQSSAPVNRCDNPHDNVYCHAEHDDITIFKNQVTAMRRWMKQHGYQNTPLIITEVGILYPEKFDDGEFFRDEYGNPFTSARVNRFVAQTSRYLETATDSSLGYPHDNNKLVQQWAWFSMYTDSGVGSSSNLLIDGWETHGVGNISALSSVGHTFRREATNQHITSNLIFDSIEATQTNGSARLNVKIRNNGNGAVTSAYTVTAYQDAALTQPIGSKSIEPILHGCATSVDTVTIDLSMRQAGRQSVWIELDSAEAIQESNERDNIKQTTIAGQ